MTIIDTLREFSMNLLPEAMWDYWYMFLIWIGIMVALLAVILIKNIIKIRTKNKINKFKLQNPAELEKTQRKLPAEHYETMQQHNVHVPHDKYQQLDSYILTTLQKGMDPKKIKEYLMNAGWNAKIVDKAIKRIKKKG